MEQPKISIIIPVYNASLTIVRCARSVFSQTMTEGVEFLFVNDGTPDNSINLLESIISEFPQIKDQIHIISNSHNLGVSDTRKKGISEARGEYIAWVDSDDWIEPEMIEEMWNATQNGTVDIVVQNVYVDSYKSNVLRNSREWKLFSAKSPKIALMNYHTDKHVPWGLPFQMSRRLMILEASKRVHNVNITEDAIMLIYLFTMANSCAWLEKALYHYVSAEKSGSLTHRNFKTKDEWKRQRKNIDEVSNYLIAIDKRAFRKTTNYIKLHWKSLFLPVFNNSWSYWITYNECYRDCISFDKTGINTRSHMIKVWIKYHFFPIFWYKEGRYLFNK